MRGEEEVEWKVLRRMRATVMTSPLYLLCVHVTYSRSLGFSGAAASATARSSSASLASLMPRARPKSQILRSQFEFTSRFDG